MKPTWVPPHFFLPQARVRDIINRQSYRIRATSQKLSGEQVPNLLFFSSMQSIADPRILSWGTETETDSE